MVWRGIKVILSLGTILMLLSGISILRNTNRLCLRNKKDNAILRERIAILRDFGYSDEDIGRIIWSTIGGSLSQLDRHQDTRLIGGAE